MIQLRVWLILLCGLLLMLGCGKAKYQQGLESAISKYRSVATVSSPEDDTDGSADTPTDRSDERDDEEDEEEPEEELEEEEELGDDDEFAEEGDEFEEEVIE